MRYPKSQTQQPETTHETVGGDGTVPDRGSIEHMRARDGVVVATAVDPGGEFLGVPEPELFRVLEDRAASSPGQTHRFKLTAGKIVSSAHYDIEALRRQGVKLARVEAGETAA